MLWLIVGLAIFLGIHSLSIVDRGFRNAMVAKLGLLPWKVLYSIVALIGFVLLVKGYGIARVDPIVLYQPPAWTRHLTMLLMLPVFPIFLSAHLPGRIKSTLKHPMLVATKLWAASHLLANGGLHDLLLFGGLLAWAVADRISVKRRDEPAAVVNGKARNDVIAIVAGLGIYVLFVAWAHGAWIGVSLMPASR
ncbi:MAG: NnrU family protein [Gammaproteobacteria bacterium]